MRKKLENKLPLITILMIVRNEEKYLSVALKSILASSLKSFELIVINDASTDKTSNILKKFSLLDNRLKVFNNKSRLGLAASLNNAFKYSKGKFIARMDGDDICYIERFMSQYQFLIRNPDIDIIGCNAKLIDAKGDTLGQTSLSENHLEIIDQWRYRCPMIHPSILMREKFLRMLEDIIPI